MKSTIACVLWIYFSGFMTIYSCLGNSIKFRVTYRDFLPSQCMHPFKFAKAWNTTAVGSRAYLRDSDWNRLDSLAELKITGRTILVFRHRFDLKDYCPFWDWIRNESISGHPDFEPRGSFMNEELASKVRKGIVKNRTRKLNSGLRVPQYSNDDETEKTTFDDQVTSNKHYFDYWYRDSAKYNKRVGLPLVLKQNKKNENYIHESGSFFPLAKNYNFYNSECKTPGICAAWPNQAMLKKRPTEKFGFTSEIHTYFKYMGGEQFSFEGDDDVWVFVNDRLALDLGGIHPSVKGTINFDKDAFDLGLKKNETYRFDMFHAERRYDHSNFNLETSLVKACNVVGGAGTTTFNQTAPDADFLTIGLAPFDASSRIIKLTTEDFNPMWSSYVWVSKKQNTGTGFVASFNVKISPNGQTEGFAFIVQNDDNGLHRLPSSVGKHLNFRYLKKSVAVVFDLCVDRNKKKTTCSRQELRIHTTSETLPDNNGYDRTRRVWTPIIRSLRLDEEHRVSVEYLENPDWLEVYVNDSLYLRLEDVKLDNILGSRSAYMGFSSSTSAKPSAISIMNFEVKSVIVKFNFTKVVPLEDIALIADGISNISVYKIVTYDGCENPIEFGGKADKGNGLFVEESQLIDGKLAYYNGSSEPKIVPAITVDNGDGSYDMKLVTDIPGSYRAYVCMDTKGCEIKYKLVGPSSPDYSPTSMRFLDESPSTHSYVKVIREKEYEFYSVVGKPITVGPAPVKTPIVPDENTGMILIYALSIGGFLLLLLLLIIIIVARKRRRWKKDKRFIEKGKDYKDDEKQNFNKDDEILALSRGVIEAKKEVLQLDAQYDSDNDCLRKLNEEQDELMHELQNLEISHAFTH